MHGFGRALLFTLGIGVFGAGILLAQQGHSGGRTTLPSSTALGAGALSTHSSSTARSSGPAFGRSGYFGAGSRSGAYGRGVYRPLPRNYVFAPYYYPWFDWSGATDYSTGYAPYSYDYGPDYSYGYSPNPDADAMAMNQAALGQQVQRLTAQVNGLMYGQPYPAQQPAAEQPGPVPLTLVLRTGEQLQVQNYAVTDDTFWDFTQRSTRKIPLSSIDLTASAKATQANGGEFPRIEGTQ